MKINDTIYIKATTKEQKALEEILLEMGFEREGPAYYISGGFLVAGHRNAFYPCYKYDIYHPTPQITFKDFLKKYYLVESEQKFEVGDWVFWHSPLGDWTYVDEIKYIQEPAPLGGICFGTRSGDMVKIPKNKMRKATKEEIQEKLLERAAQDGFVPGVTVDHEGVVCFKVQKVECVVEASDCHEGSIVVRDYWRDHQKPFVVLKNDIHSVPLAKTALIKNALPRINGYEGYYFKEAGVVKYGCAEICLGLINDIYDMINSSYSGNRQVAAIKLDSGVEITADQIEEIVKAIQGKT